MDKKLIAIIVLGIALAVSLYFNFHTTPIPYDEALIKQRENALHEENAKLLQDVNAQKSQIVVFKSQIDSISSIKQSTKIVYVNQQKEIDASSVNTIVANFAGVFAESGVK